MKDQLRLAAQSCRSPLRSAVAMAAIGLADAYGLPVSTTHVLSSGVAGTMPANGSRLQRSTPESMALAWS